MHDDAIVSTSYIEQGNQYLLRAEKNLSGGRWWVCVFMLVASFVLLFLDWYYG